MTSKPDHSTMRICEEAGISYRRLDYWCRNGIVPERARGSGSRRHFTDAEKAGIIAVANAFDEVRRLENAIRSGEVFRSGEKMAKAKRP